MPFLANNPLNRRGASPVAVSAVPRGVAGPLHPDAMFGHPGWTYTQVTTTPVHGPQPHLARGSGRTGDAALPGNAANLPGYLSDSAYFPDPFDYAPPTQERYTLPIPRSIQVGTDGNELVSTYRAHDVTVADRFFHQYRSAYNWQVQSFPANPRQLLRYQQVQRYVLQNTIQQARPLAANNYFLGYQVDPSIQASLGQTSNGMLG